MVLLSRLYILQFPKPMVCTEAVSSANRVLTEDGIKDNTEIVATEIQKNLSGYKDVGEFLASLY